MFGAAAPEATARLESFDVTPPEIAERVAAAALKVSGGSLEGLDRALALARTDWRDLLMAAGFGDLDAHGAWLEGQV